MMKCVICEDTNIYAKNKCRKCYRIEYKLKNKDKEKEYRKEYNKEYRKTEKGIKIAMINNWKTIGLIDSDNDNYEKIYQIYMDTANCDLCNVVLTTGKNNTSKNMEHDHKTGLFRNVVCHTCNVKIRDIETPCKSNTGIKNISYNKKRNHYRYEKTTNGVRIYDHFKELDDAICYSVINDMILKLENDN